MTSGDVISSWTRGCSEPQQGNDCSSCGTAQWDKQDQEGLLPNENFHLGAEQYFEQFLPLFFPLTGQSSKISSDPYNCLVLLLYYLISEELA